MRRLRLVILVPILSVFIADGLYAQGTSNQLVKKYGISGKINTLIAGGVSFDAFITPKLSAEISGALLLTMGGEIGFNYHPFLNPDKRTSAEFSPYIGIHLGYYELHFFTRTNYSVLYFPIGVQLLELDKLHLSVDIGYSPQFVEEYAAGGLEPYSAGIYHSFHSSLRLGYRFGD